MKSRRTKSADRPLTVRIEGEQLVIRVGVNTIAFVAENADAFQRYNERTDQYESIHRVADAAELAQDVVRALNHEEEDGTTPVHLLLDAAINEAAEQGSLGFEEDC